MPIAERRGCGRALWIVPALLVVAAAAQLALRTWGQPLNTTDYRYIWLAGDLWTRGINPYGAQFIAQSETIFGPGNELASWMYPFHWFLPAAALALLPPQESFHAWQLLCLVLLLVTAWLVARHDAAAGVRNRAGAWLPGVLYCLTFTALGAALRLGNPVIVLLPGLAAIALGLATGSRALQVAGAVLVSLKPQFGLPIMLCMLLSPQGLLSLVIAAPVVAALVIPAAIAVDLPAQVVGMLGNITGEYARIPINDPSQMIGLAAALSWLAGAEVSVSQGMILACAVALGAALLCRRLDLPAHRRGVAFLLVATLCVTCLVGVHPADLSLLALLLPLLGQLRGGARVAVILGYALLWRPENVALLLGGGASSIGLATCAVFLIAGGWMWHALALLRARRAAPAGAAFA